MEKDTERKDFLKELSSSPSVKLFTSPAYLIGMAVLSLIVCACSAYVLFFVEMSWQYLAATEILILVNLGLLYPLGRSIVSRLKMIGLQQEALLPAELHGKLENAYESDCTPSILCRFLGCFCLLMGIIGYGYTLHMKGSLESYLLVTTLLITPAIFFLVFDSCGVKHIVLFLKSLDRGFFPFDQKLSCNGKISGLSPVVYLYMFLVCCGLVLGALLYFRIFFSFFCQNVYLMKSAIVVSCALSLLLLCAFAITAARAEFHYRKMSGCCPANNAGKE